MLHIKRMVVALLVYLSIVMGVFSEGWAADVEVGQFGRGEYLYPNASSGPHWCDVNQHYVAVNSPIVLGLSGRATGNAEQRGKMQVGTGLNYQYGGTTAGRVAWNGYDHAFLFQTGADFKPFGSYSFFPLDVGNQYIFVRGVDQQGHTSAWQGCYIESVEKLVHVKVSSISFDRTARKATIRVDNTGGKLQTSLGRSSPSKGLLEPRKSYPLDRGVFHGHANRIRQG